MPGTANQTKSIRVGKTSTASIRFLDALGNETSAPAGASANYRLMDQFFNAERNDGKVTITPAGDGLGASITGTGLGTQNIEVDIPGLPSYLIAETTTPGPAASFVVDLSPDV